MMTKADWQKVEEALSGRFGRVKMLVDGHTITFERALKGKNGLTNAVFVDGWSKGIWFGDKNEHPEQVYLYPYTRFVLSAKERAHYKKMSKYIREVLGRKKGDEDKKVTWYLHSFPSVSAIKRYYTKTFSSIELLSINGESV